MLDSGAVSIFTYSGRPHLTPKYSGLSAQLTSLNEKSISLGLHYVAIRDCGDDSCMVLAFKSIRLSSTVDKRNNLMSEFSFFVHNSDSCI